MDPTNSNWIPTKKFFSEALLIALLTGVGYLAAFAYQYSYLKYFDIPVFFVDINLVLILLTTSFGLIWLVVSGMIFNFFVGWKPKGKNLRIIKTIGIFFTILISLLLPLIFIIYDPNHIWSSLIIFFIILIGLIIITVKLYNNPKQFDKIEIKRNIDDLLYKAEQNYGSFPILFVIIMVLFVVNSGSIGTIIAESESKYLISNSNPNLILISTYQDSFIGLTFSTTTLKFNKEITLLTKDRISQEGIIFSYREIGRLTSN